MKRLPNLKALLAFRYAGEARSFKSASEQLHVTQAAISQSIRALEDELGVKLFTRMTREVALTWEGERLLAHISSGFQVLEYGLRQLFEDTHTNRLNIGTVPSFASRWLMPRISRFQAFEPELVVSLSPSTDVVAFNASELDVAIRLGGGDYKGLEAKKLFDEYLIPVCHPDLLDSEQPVNTQLSKMRLLTDDSADLKGTWETLEKTAGIHFEKQLPGFTARDANLLVEAALNGQGLALIRYSLISDLLKSAHLLCPLPISIKSQYDCYLVAPSLHFERPKVRQFEKWLREEFRQLDADWVSFRESQLNSIRMDNPSGNRV